MTQQSGSIALGPALLGREFVNPFFDYLLIGGGLSLFVAGFIFINPLGTNFITEATLAYFILASNSAHFAASTVRLYTKPGTYQSLPYVTMGLPVIMLAILVGCMFQADRLAPQLTSLYLTWSPFHYAAQAYGLTVMYCYRSGCTLSDNNKKLIWRVAMIPFLYNFIAMPNVGLHWLDFGGWLGNPATQQTFWFYFKYAMAFLAFGGIAYLWIRIAKTEKQVMPAICGLTLLTNGLWWFLFPPLQAFVWATIFHGIQYLAIVIIFHVRDQLARPENHHSRTYHICWFYGACILLGYGLFHCFPRAFIFLGFGPVESVLLVVAVIQIHHFIVDAFIWRLKKSDSNRKIVESASPALTS
ncbi:MAG: hypothetical protein P8K78_07950 [Pirellulales bacterium]|nr:hypothetical protein [Pirellulales bacterium]